MTADAGERFFRFVGGPAASRRETPAIAQALALFRCSTCVVA
jgi:hypothetical protein